MIFCSSSSSKESHWGERNQLPRLPLPGCVGWWFVESSQCPQLSFAGCPLMSPSVAWLIKPCWMFMFWWVSTWLLLSHSFLKEALERPVGKWAMFQWQKCARACCLGEQLALQWLMGTPFISGVFFHVCYEWNEGQAPLKEEGPCIITPSFFCLMQTHSGRISDCSHLHSATKPY